MSRSRIIGVMKASIMKIAMVLIFIRCVLATNHSVGGVAGWTVFADMEQWKTTTIFYTGDNLVFVYGPLHDVLEVEQNAFETCNNTGPIAKHEGGNTIVTLDNPGHRYFICGNSRHCALGLKADIEVLNSPPRPSAPSDQLPPPLPSNGSNVPAFDPTVLAPPPYKSPLPSNGSNVVPYFDPTVLAPSPYKSSANKLLHLDLDLVYSLVIMVIFVEVFW